MRNTSKIKIGSIIYAVFWVLERIYSLPGHIINYTWWKDKLTHFPWVSWYDVWAISAIIAAIYGTSDYWLRWFRLKRNHGIVTADAHPIEFNVHTSKAVGSTHLPLHGKIKNVIRRYLVKIGLVKPLPPVQHTIPEPMLRDIQSLRDDLAKGIHKVNTATWEYQDAPFLEYFPSDITSRMYELSERLSIQKVLCPPTTFTYDSIEKWIEFLSRIKVAIEEGKPLDDYSVF